MPIPGTPCVEETDERRRGVSHGVNCQAVTTAAPKRKKENTCKAPPALFVTPFTRARAALPLVRPSRLFEHTQNNQRANDDHPRSLLHVWQGASCAATRFLSP